MKHGQTYKYEVAFSFLQEDEMLAYDLNDRIQDRLSTFIYSKQQEILGGTDGEKNFNNIFFEESRIVVILYRNRWGETSWTRIEETAIRNRAFEKGWDFLLLLNLDDKSILPIWIPKSYIWLDFQRYRAEGAIAVIEHKVRESGGHTRHETIRERVERLKRLRAAEIKRENFLNSPEAVIAAQDEIIYLINKLKQTKEQIEDPSTNLILSTSERTEPTKMFEFGYLGYYLCFNNCLEFRRGLLNGNYALIGELKVVLYEKVQLNPWKIGENVIEKTTYKFDCNLIENYGWIDSQSNNELISSDNLLERWVKIFIDDIGKRNKNRS
jgi:hypothetical protein